MSIDNEQLSKNAIARFNHQASKNYLHEKYNAKLTIASQGGLWTITPELIAFLQMFDSHVVVKDVYNNPIKVHAPTLCDEMTSLYTTVMNQWHDEYTELLSGL